MTTARTNVALGCLALLAGLGGSAAHAQDAGWYAGAGVGRSASDVDDVRIRDGLLNQGLDIAAFSENERDTAWRLFGGWQFHRHFALEAGWFDLGRFGYSASTVPAGQLAGDVRMRGFNLDLVGNWPLTERLSVLGRAGVLYAQSRGSFSAGGAVTNPYGTTGNTERGAGYKFGAGLAWQLSPAWQVRAEIERLRVKDSVGNRGDIDVASISLVYRFGGSDTAARGAQATAATPAVSSPATAATAPGSGTQAQPATPSAPATGAATPAAAPSTRVQFSADALFDFDQATLRPEGQRQLDAFVQRLRGVRVDGVLVVGHTDRLGSKAYNQKLSERRAAAVRDYLVQAGIALASMTIRGAGEDQPVTTPADCKGNAATPALIACLQPDRRVEVEATGTR